MPAARRLFSIMKTVMFWYFGITIGRKTPGLAPHVIAFCSDMREAVFLKDALQRFPGDGVILAIGEDQRQTGPLSGDKSGTLKC